jgi:hypothetical protein
MKHDIAVAASHKTKHCDKFSFSIMSVTVYDDSLVMSVTASDGPFIMPVTSVWGGSKFLPLYTSILLLNRVSQNTILCDEVISRSILNA